MDILFQFPFYIENQILFSFKNFDFMFSYAVVLTMLSILFIRKKLHLPKGLIFMLGGLAIINIYSVLNDTATIKEVIKQLFGITAFSVLIFSYIKYKKFDLKLIVDYYLNAAYILAIIGIIQELLALIAPSLKIPFLALADTDRIIGNLGRVQSLFLEPAHFALFLSPAIYAVFDHFINKNNLLISSKRAIIIFISFLLTFSTSGFLIFLILPIFFLKGKQSLVLPFFIIGLYLLISNVDSISMRVEDSWNFSKGTKSVSEVNASTYALASNFAVASINFAANPLIGTGFGSHEKQYMKQFIADSAEWQQKLNYNDAGSLLIRIISEIGLIGIGIFAYFIIKNKVKKKGNSNSIYYVINNMSLMIFTIALLRNGHYFNYTFWLFIGLYYYSFKLSKTSIARSPLKTLKL